MCIIKLKQYNSAEWVTVYNGRYGFWPEMLYAFKKVRMNGRGTIVMVHGDKDYVEGANKHLV